MNNLNLIDLILEHLLQTTDHLGTPYSEYNTRYNINKKLGGCGIRRHHNNLITITHEFNVVSIAHVENPANIHYGKIIVYPDTHKNEPQQITKYDPRNPNFTIQQVINTVTQLHSQHETQRGKRPKTSLQNLLEWQDQYDQAQKTKQN